MSAMAPDGLSALVVWVAAFGSSLGQSFDPTGVLAEFSARTQPVVPHDYMLIAVREDDGHTYAVFAEYPVRGWRAGPNLAGQDLGPRARPPDPRRRRRPRVGRSQRLHDSPPLTLYR